MILPGPQSFIIVLNFGQRFTQEEATAVKIIQETFVCGNRFHVFNNNETEDRTQVTDPTGEDRQLLKANGGSFYSCKMFRQMEREIQEQQMKILMDRVREREEVMKKIEEEKERMKVMKGGRRQNQDKERKRREEEFKKKKTI
ncbi:hypothetical protein QQF64_026102 [Cirrhinus molitorella]|uniref:AIG1-type G domain-containing protein n=1 Tax=Cirrhinus molitorella TaxID=172907 RepID=A0ABR3NR75_9TELE